MVGATLATDSDREGWEALAQQLDSIRELIEPFEILSEAEFEELRLSYLTYGLVKVGWKKKADFGFRMVHVSTNDPHRMLMLKRLAAELGCGDRSASLPDHLVRGVAENTNHFAIVEAAISNKSMSVKAALSWGRLQELSSLLSAELKGEFISTSGVKGMRAQSTEVQRYWYAQWLLANATSLDPKGREQAGADLADVCEAIAGGELEPWGVYPKKWYERVLGKAKSGLGDNFAKIGEPQILEMAKHPTLTGGVLPPLDRAAFEKK